MKEDHFDYANWLLCKVFSKKQRVQYAIYAAMLVLHIFEDERPNDKRPRKAIEAAEAYLKNPCKETKDAARAAARAAWEAGEDAWAAGAAAWEAGDAAWAAAGNRLSSKWLDGVGATADTTPR